MKRTLLFILITLLACTPLWARGLMMIGGGVAAAATPCQGANPSDCTMRETFNGSSACGDGSHSVCNNTWVSIYGWPDFNGGTLDGSTAAVFGAAGLELARLPAFTASTDIYLAFKWSASNQANYIANMTDSSDNELCRFGWDGTYVKMVNSGGTAASSNPNEYSVDTLYYVKMRAKKGTGANAECQGWISTNGTSWTNIGNSTNGTWTADIVRVHFVGSAGNYVNTIDDVRIYTADITW